MRYRRDGYCWKKRKDGKTTREDHMKLKVQGMEVRDRQSSYKLNILDELNRTNISFFSCFYLVRL